MRPRPLPYALDRASHQPLPQQVVQAVVAGVRAGRLAPGQPLPSTRALANALGVHRNTVVAAFDELRAQGWVETVLASHTRVSEALPVVATQQGTTRSGRLGFPVPPPRGTSRVFEAAPSTVLDFSGGLPDPRLFPTELLARAYRRALRGSSGKVMDFGDPAGHPTLRRQLARLLSERRGLAATDDELLITRGSQLALHLLALALVRPGDVVAVESPGAPSVRDAFSLQGARLLPIPVDAQGLNVDALAQALKRTRLRAVHVTPHHQDPTTVALSASRRLALLALARKHRFAVIEGDADYEFQFDGAPVLPLAAQDAAGVVVYVGTLSKALAPGLRLGFVVAPAPVREAMLAARAQVDRQGDLALELAVSELIEDGDLLRHSLRARREFHARRDVLAALLRARLPDVLRFAVPRGGLALWARVDDSVDVEAWAAASLARGVRFFTGRPYSPSGQRLPWVRLGFGHLNQQELGAAVKRMAAALPEAGRAPRRRVKRR